MPNENYLAVVARYEMSAMRHVPYLDRDSIANG
jgi:hypothetical protein